ncbi:MAG: sigma-70 family RNA polymerase sigma factor [Rhodothermia bacterium]|nr:sigma-70 family RNA polymerase sigma factor [Rhodothermia bacterium]
MASEFTQLLVRARKDAGTAVDDVVPIIYSELKRIAHRQLKRERSGHTLNTTALVHEAYLRLAGADELAWEDQVHFRAIAAQAMRRILVDYARRRNALRRGGDQERIDLDASEIAADGQTGMMLSLDSALSRLEKGSQRLCRVVEYRFFGGLSEEEIAAALQISIRTVRRDWVRARAWLYKELYSE